MDLSGFFFMFDYSITNHMVPYNLYRTLNLISENFSILRVVIYFLQLLGNLSTNLRHIDTL